MNPKEATARIKINRRLEEAGWRFFDDEKGAANICLEPNVKITSQTLDDMGENFEEIKNGYIDFLLLDSKGFPFIVLEAKSKKLIESFPYLPENPFRVGYNYIRWN